MMYSTGLYMYMCSRDPCSCAYCVNKKRCIVVTVRTCTCVVECLRQFGTCIQQAGFHLLGNVHYSYMTLIGMHELHGRMHPN